MLPEDTGRIKRHKTELEQTRRYVESQYTDNYYRRIEADRQRELLDEVIKRRKIVAESDLKQYNTSKIREDFNEKFDEFQNNYLAEEMRRQQALENLK